MSSIRTLLFITALCLTALSFAQDGKSDKEASSAGGQVEVKTDRFSGNVTITMKPQTLIDTAEHKLTMDMQYELKKKDIEGMPVLVEEMAGVQFDSRSNPVIDFGDEELHFLIDGKRLSIGRASSQSKPAVLILDDKDEKGRHPWNSLFSALSLSQIEQIAAGKQVDMRLGKIELTLSQLTLAAIRDFAREFAARAPTRANRKGNKR